MNNVKISINNRNAHVYVFESFKAHLIFEFLNPFFLLLLSTSFFSYVRVNTPKTLGTQSPSLNFDNSAIR